MVVPPSRRHITTVRHTRRLRDLFRKRWWIHCFHCRLKHGEYHTLMMAQNTDNLIASGTLDGPCPGRMHALTRSLERPDCG